MNTNISAAHSVPNRLSRYPYSLVQGGLIAGTPEIPDNRLRNRLLAALPEAQLRALMPHLERVEMSAGDVMHQYGMLSQHVHFPATSIVSLMYEMEDGASAEVAIVGNEGMLGVELLMTGKTLPGLAQVQCAGYGYRLSSKVLKHEFEGSKILRHLLLSYTQALMAEIGQNAVCSRHHSTRQQICRCLLARLDRSPGSEMPLTHEMIGASLGVRREYVTVVVGKLRAERLIAYRRGHVSVMDREGLEAESCECYGVVTQAFNRLLPREMAHAVVDPLVGGRSHRYAAKPTLRANFLRAMS